MGAFDWSQQFLSPRQRPFQLSERASFECQALKVSATYMVKMGDEFHFQIVLKKRDHFGNEPEGLILIFKRSFWLGQLNGAVWRAHSGNNCIKQFLAKAWKEEQRTIIYGSFISIVAYKHTNVWSIHVTTIHVTTNQDFIFSISYFPYSYHQAPIHQIKLYPIIYS